MVSGDGNGNFWEKCRTCGNEIPYSSRYFTCSVSSCNKKSNPIVFCSVHCWDIHAPVMNHKNAGAEENMSPPRPNRRIVVGPSQESQSPTKNKIITNSSEMETEILIVASKLKQYIKEKGDMNTSANVMERLSEIVRNLCDDAIYKARQEGRKTVMDRDF
jgi:hypothetical protein